MEKLVAAAVIERNGRYLLCRRALHKRHGGLWEFPGGKHEKGEGPEQALRRELEEELDARLESLGPLLFSAQDPGSPFRIDFYPAVIAGEPKALEHAELRWASPDELLNFALAPSDRAFVEQAFPRT